MHAGGSDRTLGRRVDVALIILVLLLTAPVVQSMGAQQASRLALTAAIWDDHSIHIDDYPLGVDRAEHDGHLLSDKAPGQPFWAVPAYGIYRLLGGEPARELRIEENLGLWSVSVWSSALPAAILAVVIRRTCTRFGLATATAAAAATATSTLLLPFATLLFGHVLGALMCFAGWAMTATRRDPTCRRLVAAGALVGFGVLVEYTLVLAALAIVVHVARTWGWRVVHLLAGGLPFAAMLAAYQWAAFGSPIAFSYASSSFGREQAERGIESVDLALIPNATAVMFGDRGLLIATPIVAIGVVGTFSLWRTCIGYRRSAIAAAGASAASLVAVQMAWSNPTGGDSPGARYATAAAAFLAPGVAQAWTRWRLLSRLTAAVGCAIMLVATWTHPLAPRDAEDVIEWWIRLASNGEWQASVFSMIGGPGATVLLPIAGALGAAASAWIIRNDRTRITPRRAAPASGP